MDFRDIKAPLAGNLAKIRESWAADDVLIQACFDVMRKWAGWEEDPEATNKDLQKEAKATKAQIKIKDAWKITFHTPRGVVKLSATFQKGRVVVAAESKKTGRQITIPLQLGEYIEKEGDLYYCPDLAKLEAVLIPVKGLIEKDK